MNRTGEMMRNATRMCLRATLFAVLASMMLLATVCNWLRARDQAKEFHRKVLEQDPTDPESYYSIGVIDWTQTYAPNQELRSRLSLKPDEPLKDEKVCDELRTKNQGLVKEGVDMLNQAIKLRKDYDDAMAYLNLMYRQKADIECGDPLLRVEDLKKADEFVEQAMGIKKRKAEEESKQTGIVMDQGK